MNSTNATSFQRLSIVADNALLAGITLHQVKNFLYLAIMTHGSTFSGIGAPEVAASMLGWENLFHCEINPFGRKILDYYYPECESYEDITKTDFTKWRGKVDVLTGGFPCQPFSYAGKRRGAEDDRYLWGDMLRCIDEVKPRWFVGENVLGITSMVFPGEDVEVGNGSTLFDETHFIRRDERFIIDEICENLESKGYSVQPFVVPACAVGAPHRRDRIFILARRELDCRERTLEDSKRIRCPELGKCELHGGGDIGAGSSPRSPQQLESLRNGRESDVANSCNGRCLQTGIKGTIQTKTSSIGQPDNFKGNEIKEFPYRWRTFPSVSAVYRGNDGIPFDVDGLSIPFTEWRKETLKAYGNSIVVQVMLEIFSIIQEYESK